MVKPNLRKSRKLGERKKQGETNHVLVGVGRSIRNAAGIPQN